MAPYSTVVVGTDGSDTSYAAVARAAAVADANRADLVIVSAYRPEDRGSDAATDVLGEDGHLVKGWAPAEDTLRTAHDHATREIDGSRIRTRTTAGDPVDVLNAAVRDHNADLLVVGNKGLDTLLGRVLGSVPSDAARSAEVDILIVHTT